MGYYSPPVPTGANPHTLQMVLIIAFSVAILGFAVRALMSWRRTGSPLGVLMLIGGFAAALNEALVNVAGLCWYPREGQIVGYGTFLAVPLWCVLAYASYFGGASYVLYEKARTGMTKRALWIALAALLASEAIFEITVINLGGYSYFGNQPLGIAGMPLYWFATNFTGMFLAVAVLVRMPQFFSGWRVVFALLVPAVTYGIGAFGTTWPVFNALHLQDGSALVVNLAQILTLGIGYAIIAWAISQIAVDGPLGRPGTPGSVIGEAVPVRREAPAT